MTQAAPIHASVEALLAKERPEEPLFLLCPSAVAAGARRFLAGFPGLTSYAVKANPEPAVLLGLISAGVRAFDVASPEEIRLIRRLAPEAALHYHNPVKSRAELRFARESGVRTYAVDCRAELDKIIETLPAEGTELSVRFRLPVKGAAYDFGSKFGATEDAAAGLAARAAAAGFTVSLTFHPGTQCRAPEAWVAYVEAAARIARAAGVRPARLNVGGGFPAGGAAEAPALEIYFAAIDAATEAAFGPDRPALVCEPGRALVAGAMALVTRVKLMREDGAVFLDDGVYGGLAEAPLTGEVPPFRVLAPSGRPRTGAPRPRIVFGPTCDSMDRLPGEPALPADLAEDDYVIFESLGAYGTATVTRFNGFGPRRVELVERLEAPAAPARAA
ncbi:MAG: type III PLP-dependent enzyme [Pseudomonadota bacterium]